MTYEGEKKILILLAQHGKMSKSKIRMLSNLKSETLDNSIGYLVKMKFVVFHKENEQSPYRITRDGIDYLQTIAKGEKISRRVDNLISRRTNAPSS